MTGVIEKEDLVDLLEGRRIYHPSSGIGFRLPSEVLQDVPPSLVKDLLSYLRTCPIEIPEEGE